MTEELLLTLVRRGVDDTDLVDFVTRVGTLLIITILLLPHIVDVLLGDGVHKLLLLLEARRLNGLEEARLDIMIVRIASHFGRLRRLGTARRFVSLLAMQLPFLRTNLLLALSHGHDTAELVPASFHLLVEYLALGQVRIELLQLSLQLLLETHHDEVSGMKHVLGILQLLFVTLKVHLNTLVLLEELLAHLLNLTGRGLFTQFEHLDAVFHVLDLLSEALLHLDLSLLKTN